MTSPSDQDPRLEQPPLLERRLQGIERRLSAVEGALGAPDGPDPREIQQPAQDPREDQPRA
jgi:hypothetical protein